MIKIFVFVFIVQKDKNLKISVVKCSSLLFISYVFFKLSIEKDQIVKTREWYEIENLSSTRKNMHEIVLSFFFLGLKFPYLY